MKDHNLNRFIEAQAHYYDAALSELRSGKKQSHWMWFMFPQIRGLGFSETSKRYAIQNIDEAKAYLADPILGKRLTILCNVLLNLENRTAAEIFGYPDNMKLQSSMTLFTQVDGRDSVFAAVLKKYYGGTKDPVTLQILLDLSKG